jgi:hypothetical protein
LQNKSVINIVIPSVKELRYGGRRLADALSRIASGAAPDDIRALLEEACFDCHRARHDAIDAATSKIAADLEIMVEKLEYEAILLAYPSFSALFRELIKVRDKITQTRGKRENREAIYSVIEATDFPALVASFNDMRGTEEIMKSLARKNRRNEFFGKWGLIVGGACFALGIAALVVSFR